MAVAVEATPAGPDQGNVYVADQLSYVVQRFSAAGTFETEWGSYGGGPGQFGPIGGLAADRLDKRRILYVTQTLSGALAGVFAILIATGSIEMWMVYLLALALGCVNVFDNPARQSFIAELVKGAA